MKALCSSFVHPSEGLFDICSRVQRMIGSMTATFDGQQCAMVSKKSDTLDRNVVFAVKTDCVRSAAKMRLRRVLIDMCIERLIKERLCEITM